MFEELEQVPAFLDGSHRLLYLLNMRDQKKDKKKSRREEEEKEEEDKEEEDKEEEDKEEKKSRSKRDVGQWK